MHAERRRGWVGRLAATSVAAQASVPGAYAWAVTVGPALWSRESAALGRAAAASALLALAGSIVAERRWGSRGRHASFWIFILTSSLAWSAAPETLAPSRFDWERGLLAMAAWALYAYVSAAPALPRNAPLPDATTSRSDSLRRRRHDRLDVVLVAVAVLLVGLLQAAGWRTASPERAILVRFVALAASLSLIGATTEAIRARHRVDARETRAGAGGAAGVGGGIRRSWIPLLIVGLVLTLAVILAMR